MIGVTLECWNVPPIDTPRGFDVFNVGAVSPRSCAKATHLQRYIRTSLDLTDAKKAARTVRAL